MSFEYKMVQIPPNIEIRGSGQGSEAADYLQRLVNSLAKKGWEFRRVDTIGVRATPGCFGSLLGQTSTFSNYYVVTFRRDTLVSPTAGPDRGSLDPSRVSRVGPTDPDEPDEAPDDDEPEPLEPEEDAGQTDSEDVTCLKCGAPLEEFDDRCPKCGWSYRAP